jgi:hypothetical protein
MEKSLEPSICSKPVDSAPTLQAARMRSSLNLDHASARDLLVPIPRVGRDTDGEGVSNGSSPHASAHADDVHRPPPGVSPWILIAPELP